MPQLNELKKSLQFDTGLLTLIETLKNIAASQYHMLEKDKERFAAFMESFADFFRVVSFAEVENPLVRSRCDVLGMVVVTSDSGFMGGLNAGVIEAAMEARGDHPMEKTRFIVLGDKGAAYFADRGLEYTFFRGVDLETRYEQAVELRDHIVTEVLEGRIGRVMLAYPEPISFTQQTINVIGMLPCSELFDQAAVDEDLQSRTGEGLVARARRVIVESTPSDMAEYLAKVYITSKLFEVFEDSKLAEFSARAMHLEGSVQKLEKDLKKLQHQVFRATHELVDKGMRESFSSRKKKKKKKPAPGAVHNE